MRMRAETNIVASARRCFGTKQERRRKNKRRRKRSWAFLRTSTQKRMSTSITSVLCGNEDVIKKDVLTQTALHS